MIRIKAEKPIKPLKVRWWAQAKREWVPHLMSANKEMWPREIDPDGLPWQALSPAYSKWKVRNYGNLPMLDLGTNDFQETAYVKIVGNRFRVVTTDAGVYNQFGTSKMPARPWMGVPQKSLSALAEIALKHILK